ncbi:hypothetical protein AMATHDRAFT_74165 [Amanita thiersii Skay4041]|uniref:UBC core domain-containing protein n=1 Tax=Amanita thiersii Skay4041 TaxID=703135 RepID=A0A2A9NQJ2_9AGAR|nr:hypothetical protein AMATHDRAFT_74165 [Amanita thiersii Skay4041]
MSPSSLNKNNAAVKRIMQEARELANDPSTDYSAAPLEEWHCTLRGPVGTEFEGGLYHFRILLPAEYPFRPPSIMMLTPNGRFELNTKICISFTNYHEELWQPAWGVRTAILGLQGFFPLKGQAAIGVGSIECPASERRRLAGLSCQWTCPECQQPNSELLPDQPPKAEEGPSSVQEEEAPTSTETHTINSDFTVTGDQPLNSPIGPTSLHSSSVSQSENQSLPFTSVVQTRASSSLHDIKARLKDSVHSEGESIDIRRSQSNGLKRSANKPPLFLDAAICILLVLLFAIICRRMV